MARSMPAVCIGGSKANLMDDNMFVFALRDESLDNISGDTLPPGICDKHWLSIVYDSITVNKLASAWGNIGQNAYIIKISRRFIADYGLHILKANDGTNYILGGSGIPVSTIVACIKKIEK